GRSHECDFPAQVADLPVCTGPKFCTDGTSYEIDQRVKAILQESLSVYRVDAEKLNELRPTHIITQAQCEVCAVSLKDVEEAACQIITSKPQIISLQPDSLADIFDDVRCIAKGLGVVPVGEMMVDQLKGRMEVVAKKASELKDKPRAALVEWIEPMMAGGNWMPELIEMAGGINLFGEAGKHSPWMNWEDLVAANPDIIVVSPCGFDIKRTMEEMHIISDRKEYAGLKAVKSGNVFVADGNQYFHRPGPRVLESLEMLAEMLHPNEFKFAYEGIGWIRYSKSRNTGR
ncbi:MAG: ABC transporter substrate-binding protein, partial [Candidatus Melainabacteria bacterium]|nr:ABC transporter substrate-binding protein [Candidatus Melainabacteria bacterium]